MEKNEMYDLIEQLKRHEGVVKTNDRHVIYKCPAGFYTLGIGRNVDANGGIGLSDEEVEHLLENDIIRTIKELTREYEWFRELPDGARRDAIINMHFNLGGPKFGTFQKAIGYMESGLYDLAATEFLDSRWAKQVKGRSIEVTNQIKTDKYDV
jgi:lysozyme